MADRPWGRRPNGRFAHEMADRLEPNHDRIAGKLGHAKPGDFNRWMRPEEMVQPGVTPTGD